MSRRGTASQSRDSRRSSVSDAAGLSKSDSIKSGASPRSTSSRRNSTKGAHSKGRRRSSVVAFKDGNSEIEDFLGAVNAQSTKQDVTKMLGMLKDAAEGGPDTKTVKQCCQAIARVCQDRKGFTKFLKARGVDVLIQAAQLPQKEGGEAAMRASRPVCEAASGWMDEVDEVEFTELPDLMDMTRQLGVFDEGVAISALCAMERFGLHRREHAAAMLDAGALAVLHQMINAHRNPELLQDAHILLYRLCDLPAENVLPFLTEELDLVKTVSEALSQAPLNMKLQMSGLRLFTLWSKLGDRKVQNAISRASAQATLQNAQRDLTRAGFVHTADWLDAVAGRALSGAMPAPPAES